MLWLSATVFSDWTVAAIQDSSWMKPSSMCSLFTQASLTANTQQMVSGVLFILHLFRDCLIWVVYKAILCQSAADNKTYFLSCKENKMSKTVAEKVVKNVW